MRTAFPPATSQQPVVRYGAGTRVFMLAVGFLFTATFGPAGVFALREVAAAKSARGAFGTMLVSVLVLAAAVYGLMLAWRGLRGSWRPAPWTRRLANGVAIVFAVLGLAVIPSTVRQFFRMDHLAMLRAGLRAVGGLDWYFTLMTIAAPVQIAAHELGHVIAGRWVGFEFLSIQVGPFCLDRPLRRWRVTWQPMAFGFGGRATMLFHGRHDLPARTAIFAAGGPGANLLVAALTALASAAAARPTSSSAALTLGVLNACAIEGVLLGVFNLIPIRLASNDGARILDALRALWSGARDRDAPSVGSNRGAERGGRSRAHLRATEATRDVDERDGSDHDL